MIQTHAHFSTNTLYVNTHLDDEDVNFTNFTIKKTTQWTERYFGTEGESGVKCYIKQLFVLVPSLCDGQSQACLPASKAAPLCPVSEMISITRENQTSYYCSNDRAMVAASPVLKVHFSSCIHMTIIFVFSLNPLKLCVLLGFQLNLLKFNFRKFPE